MGRQILSVAVLVFYMGTPAHAQFTGGGTGSAAAAPARSPTLANNAAISAGNAAYERRDFATAAGQFASACDAGNVAACGILGDMYVNGTGLPRSSVRAAAPLAKACDGGLVTACAKLGMLYDNGDGVPLNKSRAFILFNAACSKSDSASCFNLGRLYEQGQGTALNVAQAASLYQRACDSGYGDGCSNIGALYARGVHFVKNENQAKAFYILGCSRGSSSGCQRNDALIAQRESNRKFAVAQAEQQRIRTRTASSTPTSQNPKNPMDCIRLTTIAPPKRRTYTECDQGDCKTYYQDSVSQHADDGLYYMFNSPRYFNSCSRPIEFVSRFHESYQKNQAAHGKPRLEDFSTVLQPGEKWIWGENSVDFLSAKWANL